jgi:hypothetical protein
MIKWKGKDDDFTAHVGKFCLRAEKMDRNHWWCCVYYGDDTVKHSSARTLKGAKSNAVKIMNKYKKQNNLRRTKC